MSGGILDSFQTIIPTAAAVLSERRQILRMTQQEVADRANITLRQYRTGISDSCEGPSSIKMLYVGAVYFSSGDWCVLE